MHRALLFMPLLPVNDGNKERRQPLAKSVSRQSLRLAKPSSQMPEEPIPPLWGSR